MHHSPLLPWIALAALSGCSLIFDEAEGDQSPSKDGVRVWSGPVASHTCASKGASVVCWGDNAFGQLGTGDRLPSSDAAILDTFVLPSADNPSPVEEMSLGYAHTCALLENGGVYCWGSNSNGQLGLGDTADRGTPLPQEIPLANGLLAYQISAGFDYNCARLENDEMQCWGNATALIESFGLDSTETVWGDDEYPQDNPAIPVGFGVRSISLGEEHGCAVEIREGSNQIQCWGDMTEGGVNALMPVANFPETPKQVVSGEDFSCIRDENDQIRCWGNNDTGQCGQANDGAFIPAPPMDPIEFDTALGADQIMAGSHHVCAVINDGALRCWGAGLEGALGQGSADNIGLNGNIKFATTQVPLDEEAVHVATGHAHTCAALKSGVIRCWGSNKFGQLGIDKSCEELGGSGDASDGLCNYGDQATELAADAVPLNLF